MAEAPDSTNVAAVQEQLDKFTALGLTPEQMDAALRDYADIIGKQKETPQKSEPKEPKAEPKTDPKSDKIRTELLELFPELKDISSVQSKLDIIAKHVTEGAQDKFRDANLAADEQVAGNLAKDFNVDPDTVEGKKFIETVQGFVADAIYAREPLLNRLAKGDLRVVKEVLKEFKDKGLFDSMKIPSKRAPKDLPFLGPRNNPFKDTAVKLQEHLKTIHANARFRAIGTEVYDKVFHPKED